MEVGSLRFLTLRCRESNALIGFAYKISLMIALAHTAFWALAEKDFNLIELKSNRKGLNKVFLFSPVILLKIILIMAETKGILM